MDFPISSADCKLLLLLESTGSVREVARLLRRDVSVVSRQIGKLASEAPVVEKVEGRWRVSATGRKLTGWTRDSIDSQKRILRGQTSLKIATTREFAARILAPQIAKVAALGGDESVLIELISGAPVAGIEDLLLKGECDVGLDCGVPMSPLVRFQRLAPETFGIVASPELLRRGKARTLEELTNLPYLQFTRISGLRLLRLESDLLKPRVVFDDLAALRAACISGVGWSVVPIYAVREELKAGQLVQLSGKGFPEIEPESFGIWWLRDRREVLPWVEKLKRWLKQQSLS